MPILAIYDDRSAGIRERPFVRSVGALELRSCLIENLRLDLFALVIFSSKILSSNLGFSGIILKEKL